MKKAKKMFEKLGYWKNTSACYDKNNFIYEKPSEDGSDIFKVQFSEKNCSYSKRNPRGVVVSALNGAYFIEPELHRAIHQQMKELNWIEESGSIEIEEENKKTGFEKVEFNKKMYWQDSNKNKWSCEKHTQKEAEERSENLTNCTNCVDCKNCAKCWDCIRCVDCTLCEGCKDCTHCEGCKDCRECGRCWDCIRCAECAECVECTGCDSKINKIKVNKEKRQWLKKKLM